VFAVAAETSWPEERILFMPLARLAQYQHCLLRRNGVRTSWAANSPTSGLARRLEEIRQSWNAAEQS
jgi:hypothetical protein